MIETDFTEKDACYYDSLYATGYHTHAYQPLYDTILDFLGRMDSPKVLEVACGTGVLASQIISRGIPHRGFDISSRAIDLCWQQSPDGEFWVGDAYDPASYRPRDYNLILALEVFEHIDDLRAIRNFPDGAHVLFSVPNFLDPAHLRAYVDPQQDIVQRLAGLVSVGQVLPFRFNTPDNKTLTIFLAHGVVGCKAAYSPLAP